MTYKEIPSEMNFNTIFPTYILAYCPDINEWYATNKRFWYYEYGREFSTEEEAINFFENNLNTFTDITNSILEKMGQKNTEYLYINNKKYYVG